MENLHKAVSYSRRDGRIISVAENRFLCVIMASGQTQTFASLKNLAWSTGYSEKTCLRRVTSLEEKGITINIQHKTNHPSIAIDADLSVLERCILFHVRKRRLIIEKGHWNATAKILCRLMPWCRRSIADALADLSLKDRLPNLLLESVEGEKSVIFVDWARYQARKRKKASHSIVHKSVDNPVNCPVDKLPYGQNCPPIRNPYDKIVDTVACHHDFPMIKKSRVTYLPQNERLKDYLNLKDIIDWRINTSKQEMEDAWLKIQQFKEFNYRKFLADVREEAQERKKYGSTRATDDYILALKTPSQIDEDKVDLAKKEEALTFARTHDQRV